MPTTPAKRFYRNKRGVKVFSNAVPRGAMGKNKATTTTTTDSPDDDSRAASRAAPELDACAAEFHPAPPQGSYRDAAAPSAAPSVARGDTPSGPLSNADSSGETSEDGDATHGANESAGAGDDNNARAVDEAQWPSLRQASRRNAREPVAAAAADDDDDAEDEDVEESWRCDECHQRNRPARADCRRCGIARVTHSSHSSLTSPPRRTVPPPTPPAGPPPPLTVIRRAMERRDEHPPSATSPPPSLERQGSLLRTLLPNLPEDSRGDDDVDDGEVVSKEVVSNAWADERADDLPTLPPSFANAPNAIAADVADDVADDMADDAESAAESPAAGMHRDFGEGFDAPVDVAPPPGFLHADADAAPVESASVVALAALQAALAAERAARDAADAARPLVRARPSGPASASASASDAERTASILSRMDATMDSRLALLERCIVGQLEGLRSEVEAGARERAELRARLESLEGQRASGETIAKKSEYSCPPPCGDGRRPASPPPAPRLERGRPPPIAIDVEDVHDDAREDPRRIEREHRRIERDDDADDVVEEDDDDVEPEHPGDIPLSSVHRDEEVQPPGTFQPGVGRASPRGASDALADDAAEFEATLAGFRSTAPAPLAANPFEGLATSLSDDEDDLSDDEASKPGTFQKHPEHRTAHRDGEKARPLPGRRANPANPAPRAPDPTPREETVEEALAAIALEEEQRAARQRAGGKRGSRKGSRKGNGTDRRQALVDAYLELSKRKATAKGEGDGDFHEKLSKRKAVRWADELVPSAAVTGERIRAFVRATTTTALGARLADVFGGDSFGGTRLG